MFHFKHPFCWMHAYCLLDENDNNNKSHWLPSSQRGGIATPGKAIDIYICRTQLMAYSSDWLAWDLKFHIPEWWLVSKPSESRVEHTSYASHIDSVITPQYLHLSLRIPRNSLIDYPNSLTRPHYCQRIPSNSWSIAPHTDISAQHTLFIPHTYPSIMLLLPTWPTFPSICQ